MKTKLTALTVSLLFSSVSVADIQWNGFSSIAMGQTTSSDESYLDYDDNLDFDNGSLFALQATSDLGNGLGVTAQLMARGDEDWDPELAWAYISYDVNDDFRVLVGRQRAPFYMYSDYLDVSYAYLWISPPNGVYDLFFDSFDGLGLLYNTTAREFDLTVQGMYGNNSDTVELLGTDGQTDIEKIAGLSLSATRDWLMFRAAYFVADSSLSSGSYNSLLSGWRQAGFADIASNIEVQEDSSAFLEFGFQADYNDYIVIAEYAKLDIDNAIIADEKSYYFTLGKRFNDMTVHVTYGVDEEVSPLLTGGVPLGVNPELDSLKTTTDGITDLLKVDSRYVTLGLRWDFHESAALKFEYTDFTDDISNVNDAGLFRAALVSVF